jgi:type III secretion protein SpaR/YscT/HrcT
MAPPPLPLASLAPWLWPEGAATSTAFAGAVSLAAARTVPLAWLVPVFGGPRVAAPFRIGLGLLLALLCVPAVYPAVGSSGAPMGPIAWALVGARELLVGATVGFCAAAMFAAAAAAGRIVDLTRGTTVAEILSPTSGQRTSPTGELYVLLAMLVFFELGGLRMLATALGRSYEAIPIVPGAATLGGLRPATMLVVACVAKLLESAVGLAAPVLVAMWLGDAALGILARVAPQLPIGLAAVPAKALLGLGLVLLGLGAVDAALAAGLPGWAALWQRAFAVWRGP